MQSVVDAAEYKDHFTYGTMFKVYCNDPHLYELFPVAFRKRESHVLVTKGVVSRSNKKVRLDDTDYAFTSNKSYLDFIMIVRNEMGLDVFLPKSPSSTSFALSLCLTLLRREFRVKHGNPRFNPMGCIMYVGKMSVEELWIEMAPASFFEDVTCRFNMNQRHGNMRMVLRHFRQIMAYILKVLQQLPDMDIFVDEPYNLNLHDGLMV
jgi:hypothetical protein